MTSSCPVENRLRFCRKLLPEKLDVNLCEAAVAEVRLKSRCYWRQCRNLKVSPSPFCFTHQQLQDVVRMSEVKTGCPHLETIPGEPEVSHQTSYVAMYQQMQKYVHMLRRQRRMGSEEYKKALQQVQDLQVLVQQAQNGTFNNFLVDLNAEQV